MAKLILIINTGNTSTKIGIYDNYQPVFVESIKHSDEKLAGFKSINAQKDFRKELILNFLADKNIKPDQLTAISARGGLLKPLESGTYVVNQKMITDLVEAKRGMHASHLSAQIGCSIAREAKIPCYVVDPISVDEISDIARFSGHRIFERVALSHALNMKAVAKRYAREEGLDYNTISVLVVHLGTGISISIHKNGQMIDIMNPSEEGAFSLDRSGGLPLLQAAQYIIENKLTFPEFRKMVFGDGGIQSYLNTKDFVKIKQDYKNGYKNTVVVVNAMAYQVAKEIGALATVVNGKIRSILLTGGIAHADFFVKLISERVEFIAPVKIFPGEDEIQALAEGACRIINNEETAKVYD